MRAPPAARAGGRRRGPRAPGMGGYSEGLEGRPPPVVEAAERAVLAAGALVRARVGAAEVVATKKTARDLVTAVDGEVQAAIRSALLGQYPAHAFLGEEGFEAGALEEALGSGAEHCWILDPLDGTTNFVHGLELSGVSLGLSFRGEMAAGIVFDPFRDELFTAWKGGGAYVTRGSGAAGARRRLSVDSAASAAEAVVYTGYAATDEAVGPFLRGIGGLSRNVRAVRMLGSAALMFAWVAAGRGSAYVEVDLSPWDICAGALLVREAGGTVTGLDGSPYELTTRAVAASNGKVHGALLDLMAGADAVGLDGAAEQGEDWTAGLRNFE